MQISEIRRRINGAVSEDNRTRQVAAAYREAVRVQGMTVPEDVVAQAVQFVYEYIQHVPALLETTQAAARQAGVEADVSRLLAAAEQYWFDPHDVLPDHHGLIGLLDDAYVFLALVQGMSNNWRNSTGRPLISLDLTAANLTMRRFIGEPFASQLDNIVLGILQGPNVQAQLNALLARAMQYGSFSTLNTPDPIWGNASVDEIVNARMGAMGIV